MTAYQLICTLAIITLMILIAILVAEVTARVRVYLEVRHNKREARRRFDARQRGRIAKVGTIMITPDDRQVPWGFEIDCEGRVPAGGLVYDGERVRMLYGGWTEEELLEIARNPTEWQA